MDFSLLLLAFVLTLPGFPGSPSNSPCLEACFRALQGLCFGKCKVSSRAGPPAWCGCAEGFYEESGLVDLEKAMAAQVSGPAAVEGLVHSTIQVGLKEVQGDQGRARRQVKRPRGPQNSLGARLSSFTSNWHQDSLIFLIKASKAIKAYI